MLLNRNILSLRHVAATEKTRYAMSGIYVTRNASGTVECAATDGKMLAFARFAPESLPRMPGTVMGLMSEVSPGRSFNVVLPTVDEVNAKGDVTAESLPSLVHGARKRARKTPAGSLPKRPSKPERKKMPKRPKLAPMPSAVKLPKRPSKDDDAGLAAWYAKRAEAKQAREARAESRKARNQSRENWRGVCTVVKRENNEARIQFKKDLSAWKEACRHARKASDVIALDCTADTGTVRVAVPSGSDAERFDVQCVEGFFPPYQDVMPARSAANFRLVIDAGNLDTLARGFECLSDAQEGISDASIKPIIVLSMEGPNVRIAVSHRKRWNLPEDFSLTSIVNPDNIDGSGTVTIGFDPGYLLRLARALHGACGSDSLRVEIGIKDAQSAITVEPVNQGMKPLADTPDMRVTGVLMPINLG